MSKVTVGQIIESYQGKFAKVLAEDGAGRLGISAWRQKKEDAEGETVVVRFLNTFGLSQVLKDGTNVPGDAPKAKKAEDTVPEKSEETESAPEEEKAPKAKKAK